MSSPAIASRPLPTEAPVAGGGGDELDEILNYNAGVDDPFSDNYIPQARRDREAKEAAEKAKRGADIGIDAEVEVERKPRAPAVKLDEEKLLSSIGLTKLRDKASEKLKFRGKGHEFEDTANLLSFYQIWLDDLFPKGKFLDSLAQVEKMGHKKRVQMARMELIDQGKPKATDDHDSLFGDPELPPRENEERSQTTTRVAPIFEKQTTERPMTPDAGADVEMDDLYDANPIAPRQKLIEADNQQISANGGTIGSVFGPAKGDNGGDDEFPGDLDALLAEEETLDGGGATINSATAAKSRGAAEEDDFDDEMEAMAEMEGW